MGYSFTEPACIADICNSSPSKHARLLNATRLHGPLYAINMHENCHICYNAGPSTCCSQFLGREHRTQVQQGHACSNWHAKFVAAPAMAHQSSTADQSHHIQEDTYHDAVYRSDCWGWPSQIKYFECDCRLARSPRWHL